MAQFPDQYRADIQRSLDAYSAKKGENLINLSILQSENDILDELIQIGEESLDYLNTQLSQPTPTNFTLTSPTPGQAEMTWDNMGTGINYVIEMDLNDDGLFTNSEQKYQGAYTTSYTDQLAGASGDVAYYRIKSIQEGKDDSDWNVQNVILS